MFNIDCSSRISSKIVARVIFSFENEFSHEPKPYYKNISDSVDVLEDIGRSFGHDFPTDDGEPIKILNHLYEKNLTMTTSGSPTYSEFSINSFCPGKDCGAAGMHDKAYLSASEICRNGEIECPVHVYLHGCTLSVVLVGTGHMKQTYYANIAEEHDFIVVFLQTSRGVIH